jgi:hypothetical protein
VAISKTMTLYFTKTFRYQLISKVQGILLALFIVNVETFLSITSARIRMPKY